jgi:hypothetical protein
MPILRFFNLTLISSSLPEDDGTLKSKSSSKVIELSNDDIHAIVLSIRAIMNNSRGFTSVFSDETAIYRLTKCMLHTNLRTKTCVMELLSAMCMVEDGHEKVIRAFNRFRMECRESDRFKTLMEQLYDPVNLNNVDFIAAAMQFINVLVHSVEDLNYRVFLQHEFATLGLEDLLKVRFCFWFKG